MITNKLNLPQPFVDAATSDHRYTKNRYSVTDILGGTCEAILKRRHEDEIEDDVADRVWAILGTAIHKVLQEAKATDTQLQENWISVPVGTRYELSDIFDLYDDSTGTVTDYKSCSVWKVTFGDFEDWRRQTLLYCWMLRVLGFDARRGEIVAIMRDHQMRKAKTEKDYPQHPVLKVGWDFSDDDIKGAETYVLEWFGKVRHQELLEDDGLEPCSPEQRWHKDDKWAVMKKGRKTAVRVYGTRQDAYQRAAGENREAGKELYYVEERLGEDTKCESYCPVADFCPHRKAAKDS